ncbi:recombination mediator RecR [Thermocrinis jamiesonii]|jgi:DNA replication and repair protein RecR|uniref:recombination mediator RecR n=1 Tax=Thermocrinis jamiesonii TaxID=1302351 RepID=UPI000497C2C5|nr:recombination mediator RecR [Thermocrinis jamiesonii]
MFEDYFPKVIKDALEGLTKIPTYGERTSSRFVYNFLKLNKEERERILNSLISLSEEIKTCSECGLISDTDPCRICSDPKRSKKFICVVEESQDAYAIEKLERYTGVYHVLGGRIAPLEGISPQDLNIDKLFERVETYNAKEVIIATNPNLEGEATANYLIKLLKRRFNKLKVSRISHGLQFGSLIELADDLSLEKSIEKRTIFP